MENRKPIKILIVVAALLFTPVVSNAYDVSTHVLITDRIIQEYESLNGETFTSTQVDLIVQGAKDEDELTTEYVETKAGYTSRRPLNHFYNPQNGRGLNTRIRKWYTLGTKFKGMPSPDWATDTLAQAEYGLEHDHTYNDKLFDSTSDFSWQKAIYEYSHGDKNKGLKALGHVLHLVEDLSVPEHVRNDPHPPNIDGEESPFEAYTENLAPTYTKLGVVPKVNSLKGLMHELALFTNVYFLSKDTIFTDFDLPRRDGLTLVRAVEDGSGEFFGMSQYGELVRIRQEKTWSQAGVKEFYYLTDTNNKILSNYYKHLSQKAVEYGVATIELFFREVEQERKTQKLKYMNKSRGEVSSISRAIKDFGKAKFLLGSSLSAVDAYELNEEDWEGARRAASMYDMEFPLRPEGISVLDDADSDESERLVPGMVPQPPTPQKVQGYEIFRTIIRGKEDGTNEIITPAQQARDLEQMGTALLALESLLESLMSQFNNQDNCNGIDLSILKHSNCIAPADEGGYAYGAGGAGGVPPLLLPITLPIFCIGGPCI